MSEKNRPLRVTVTMEVEGEDGYTMRPITTARLVSTGPRSVRDAIEEAKALASKCVNAVREATVRAEAAAEKAAPVPDPDTIPDSSPF